MNFSSDNRSFFLNENLFIPVIGDQDECNINAVNLACALDQDLNWHEVKKNAFQIIERGKYLFWCFCFGLEEGPLLFEDTARFLSLTVAIETFLKEVYPFFADKTFGASIYKGNLDIASRFLWSETHEKNLTEGKLSEELYCTDVFAGYLHRLASFFPDSILPFCFFNISTFSVIKSAQLLSKERFAHLHLAIKGEYQPLGSLIWDNNQAFFSQKETRIGILLPIDERCSVEVLARLQKLLEKIEEAPRVIPETIFNEQWDGIDIIYALEDKLTVSGKRQLQGFAAAGGEIILVS